MMKSSSQISWPRPANIFLCLVSLLSITSTTQAQIRPTPEEAIDRVRATFGPPPGFQATSKRGLVWADRERRMVICDGYVALRGGMLEMFACQAGTKEHESVVAVFCQASEVHGSLLAVGAKSGTPVQFEPFKPASGDTIKISVLWYDEQGIKHSASAQDWIEEAQTKKPMEIDWVFAGSDWVKSESENKEIYLGDYGDFITVANFPSATLDLAVRSDASNSNLLFEPATEKIPPLFTPVRLVLQVTEDKPRG